MGINGAALRIPLKREVEVRDYAAVAVISATAEVDIKTFLL